MVTSKDSVLWWFFTFPPAFFGSPETTSDTILLFGSLLVSLLLTYLLSWALSPGGPAWKNGRSRLGRVPIPGPRGLPILGSMLALTEATPHRALAAMSRACGSAQLMAFSVGGTPAVVSSDPATAREILSHPSFSDRPLKRSARELLFGRAIGFAPHGQYWRHLRRLAASHLFAPRRIAAHELSRRADLDCMVQKITAEQTRTGSVHLRRHLQAAALNNIMGAVFGRRYDASGGNDNDVRELKHLVREGFELLGAFNWSDHLPWLSSFYDPHRVTQRCAQLVPRVRRFVKRIIDEHKADRRPGEGRDDFVDVLLSLEGEERLEEDDMIAVLWEMIFRGTDTTALLTEWAMAELVLNPGIQTKLRAELDSASVVHGRPLTEADTARLPYLQAVIKETLRAHPPAPLLSWARLSTSDVELSNGMVVPARTTAMVNMWSITHDPAVWAQPEEFRPRRFVPGEEEGGEEVDVRGADMRLAPFGAGRRVCPGKNLGLVTVGAWVARLVREFEWEPAAEEVDLSEVLKLSCEMKTPLVAVVVPTSKEL